MKPYALIVFLILLSLVSYAQCPDEDTAWHEGYEGGADYHLLRLFPDCQSSSNCFKREHCLEYLVGLEIQQDKRLKDLTDINLVLFAQIGSLDKAENMLRYLSDEYQKCVDHDKCNELAHEIYDLRRLLEAQKKVQKLSELLEAEDRQKVIERLK
jgi:hypothetical protein